MTILVCLPVFLSIMIVVLIADSLYEYVVRRKEDKKRQANKNYFAQRYYAAPSEREAEYWLERYNKGK